MRPAVLYHATTPKKLARYTATGRILSPVRGFSTEEGARFWGRRTGRTVFLRVDVDAGHLHKLPDHHNVHGSAWWCERDCRRFEVIE